MKKSLKTIVMLAVSGLALVGCGQATSSVTSTQATSSVAETSNSTETSTTTSTEEEVTITLEKSYLASSYAANALNGYDAVAYQVNLFSGNYYQYIETTVKYGYSMTIGVTTMVNYGTYEVASEEDGVAEIKLNNADCVLLNSYSKAGGFDININTNNVTYPVELPAKVQGEVNNAASKADVVNYCGKGFVIYANTSVNTFAFTNEETATFEKTVNDKASADTSALTGDIKKMAAVGNFDIAFKEVTEGETTTKKLNTFTADCEAVILDEANNYEHFKTNVRYGYSMLLSTTSTATFGKGTLGDSEDGATKLSLAVADDVNLVSFSKAGGFNITVNTADETLTYPVELPATTQGEKNMKNSKAEVIAEVGQAVDVWLLDGKGQLALTDPNA